MLFLALKKVQMVKIIPCQILTTEQRNPATKFTIAPNVEISPIQCYFENPELPIYTKRGFFGKTR